MEIVVLLSGETSARFITSVFDRRIDSKCVFRWLNLPAASVLPIVRNENFGTFSFYGQHSNKLSCLPCVQRTASETCSPALGNNNLASDSGICFEDLLQLLTSAVGPTRTFRNVRIPLAFRRKADLEQIYSPNSGLRATRLPLCRRAGR
jgi:hypothetical protein